MQNDLREIYYMGIRDLTDENDIRENLPNPGLPNYMELMDFIYNKLNMYLKEQLVEMEESLGTDMHELYQEEVNLAKMKLAIVEELVRKNSKQKKDLPLNHLIFANRGRETYFENDLKNVPKEIYDVVLEKLNETREGCNEDNIRKARALTGPLAGLNEVKDRASGLRIIYRKLGGNVLYVQQVVVKKVQNSEGYERMLERRRDNTDQEFELYMQALKDPNKRKAILDDADKLTENIFELVSSRKRGSK